MPVKKSATKSTSKKSITIVKESELQKTPADSKQKGIDWMRLGESYTSLILGIIVVVVATILLLTYVHGKNSVNNSQQVISSQHTITQQKKIAQVNTITTPKPTIIVSHHTTKKVLSSSKPKVIASKHSKTVISMVSHSHKSRMIAQLNNKHNQSNRTYTVQKGDTLWDIAQKEYNNGYDWTEIARANNLNNPGMIFSGNDLVIPQNEQQSSTANIAQSNSSNSNVLASATVQAADANAANAITGTSYTVVKGDNLWSIAVRAYGDGYDWVKIAHANNLNNPGIINSGNVLSIPRG